ncbi:hypothetical protein F157LOC_00356 [Pectobacterium brasiliense]|uniref:ABC transporter permease n=1 Tax=Pectobacterium brasiliense TaxID=180957 RepID=UPI000CE697AE|nr:ABC-2 family transporter protein [Pectobacterium brasiliense]PPE61531.1 hypothetical protein F157LOC_00356 [Pectobacterium brasiliense]
MYFILAFKNLQIYRAAILLAITGSIISTLLSIILWKFLYQHDDKMMNFMFTYAVLSTIISFFYTSTISNLLAEQINKGDFIINLLRPINFLWLNWQKELATIAFNIIYKAIPLIIFFSPILIHSTYSNISLFILTILLSHILFILIFSFVGFLAFIYHEIWPMRRLFENTIRLLGGSLFPLAMLPPTLESIAQSLPFHFLYSFPINLLLGKLNGPYIIKSLFVLCVWIFLFVLINYFIYRNFTRKMVVQGG